jgi:nicotinamidase/pyrazinamidase
LQSLRDNQVEKTYICGLCYDFCVGRTALDSALYGFETYLIADATRGVSEDAIEVMKKRLDAAGVQLLESSDI